MILINLKNEWILNTDIKKNSDMFWSKYSVSSNASFRIFIKNVGKNW